MSQENNGKPKGFINKTIYLTGFTCGKIKNANNRITKALDLNKFNSKAKDAIEATKERSIKIANEIKNSTSEAAESFLSGIKSVKTADDIKVDKEITLKSSKENRRQKSKLTPDKEITAKKITPETLKKSINDDLEKEIEEIDKAIKEI